MPRKRTLKERTHNCTSHLCFIFSQPDSCKKSLVVDEGFPFETHHVKTEDGYILEMHRIPGSGGNDGTESGKHPVLIKHGLGENSAVFLLGGATKSLALILADKGYDVWLGNSRGNWYSRNHTTLEATSSRFWNFSWHEIGLYDNSAMMDYILEMTKQEKLFYICHSEGCTELFVLVSLRPEYNDKMHIAVNLAPAVFMGNLKGILTIVAKFTYVMSFIFDNFGHINIMDRSSLNRMLTNFFCSNGIITQPVCMLSIFSRTGFSSEKQDPKIFADFLSYFPSGGSSKQIIHYGMNYFSPGEFRQYDYGSSINQNVYHSERASKYPLEKATLPVAIFYGSNDFLATAKDVELLVKTLPRVVGSQLVKGFNHIDFVIASNARNKVYQLTLQYMEPYKNK